MEDIIIESISEAFSMQPVCVYAKQEGTNYVGARVVDTLKREDKAIDEEPVSVIRGYVNGKVVCEYMEKSINIWYKY